MKENERSFQSSALPIALVTGATSGIGREAALALSRCGHRVVACGRNSAALEAIAREAEEHQLPLVAMRLDVTLQSEIDEAAARVRAMSDGHGVDVLVNSAGFGLVAPVVEIDSDDLQAQFETNVFGLVAVTQAFVPEMQKRRKGRVVHIGSLGGTMTMPLMGAYSATKYALEAIADAMRLELRPFGIEVSLIDPGMIATDFKSRLMAGSYAYRHGRYGAVVERFDVLAERFEQTAIAPDSVVRAIVHAATARRARARYVRPRWLGSATRLLGALPKRWVDALYLRIIGRSTIEQTIAAVEVGTAQRESSTVEAA